MAGLFVSIPDSWHLPVRWVFIREPATRRRVGKKAKLKSSVGYLRQNFWPLRTFTDLADVNSQVRQWLEQIANKRIHRETRQIPDERFRPECLGPLPPLMPDYRDTACASGAQRYPIML